MDTKTDTTVTPLKRFLVALPIFDRAGHDDEEHSGNEPDQSLPWLSPHSWLFTIRAPDKETAIDAVYDLIADQKRLADLHGGLCFDTDESGNEVGSLSYNGYFVGNPQIVEVLGEVMGVQEVDLSAVKPADPASSRWLPIRDGHPLKCQRGRGRRLGSRLQALGRRG